jgi:hypothetical protein
MKIYALSEHEVCVRKFWTEFLMEGQTVVDAQAVAKMKAAAPPPPSLGDRVGKLETWAAGMGMK